MSTVRLSNSIIPIICASNHYQSENQSYLHNSVYACGIEVQFHVIEIDSNEHLTIHKSNHFDLYSILLSSLTSSFKTGQSGQDLDDFSHHFHFG